MKGITYGVREEIYRLGDARRVAFGIAAYANAEENGTATVVRSVGDVSGNKDEILELVRLCNECELDPMHLMDVVEDFIFGDDKNKM